jgi:hypothetical protein
MLFGQVFLYYYIIKASPCLALYRLKDKKGSGALRRLTALKTMANYYLRLFETTRDNCWVTINWVELANGMIVIYLSRGLANY